tara:strand:+ start:25 stop:378 length:354 start_codon:yes stop_codon:yes gene_type:complete
MKNLLIICALLFTCFNFAQYEVLHINSAWNSRHNLDIKGLKNAKVKYMLLDDQTPSFKQQIKSVPTIIILDKDKKTKGLWSGGIALKLKVTKKEIQDHIDRLVAQESNKPLRRSSTN